MNPLATPTRITIAVLLGLSLLAPACSRAGSSTAPVADGKYAAWLDYSRCMRSHGVPSFPAPKRVAGGGIQVSGSAPGINPQSPLFVSAQQSCRHLMPGGGQPTRAGQQQALARMLRISRCMRTHGISVFPDPTLAPPSSRAGYRRLISNGVAWLAIPIAIDVRSPAFDRATAACNLGLS